MNTVELKTLIENKLGANTTALIESDDNVHFNATIISDVFSGVLSKVKQQQMVYAAINEYIASGELHAIAMKTYTPEKWQALAK
ncbi:MULTISPECIES: BolA/IbaG family iron-sulfur metabolism protein [unclassified Cysteiniphilum]|uniref:BolA family protein n=1 Tax=unclassified Cysteiniphilum TaxID=2610889 RepID=UPI0012465702|nr:MULTISPECIES: BolA/IbaG family iron-sulfur metabolism protein [unclassified Cysteiniphilum]WHN65828.1 BolA/IbaG family iron-sulfur metabolism protein [Cysteiniphilum sp. QT6929]